MYQNEISKTACGFPYMLHACSDGTDYILYIVMGFCDLHEQAYVVYYGDFTVSDRFQLNGNLMLHDGNQTSVHMQGDFSLPNGEHTGYVVYSERTHLLLAYDPNDNPLNRK